MIEDIRQVAETLAGVPVQAVTPEGAGGNSRIFRVETTTGDFALKVYPARPDDPRQRGDVEFRALQFLYRRGVRSVPRPRGRDATGQFLLMEWVGGQPVIEHNASDLAQAADFVAAVFRLSRDPDATAFPLASQGCLSAAEIVRQIDERLSLLTPPPALSRFLERRFAPLLAAQKTAASSYPGYDEDLPADLRRLIPADFGFHNALRQQDGSLRFVDFEYFGWDDPVKLAADFLLHPAMRLSAKDRRYFASRLASVLADDAGFRERLRRRLPLFALRWLLILFNPFRRDRTSEMSVAERRTLLQDRAAKAEALLPWAENDAALYVSSLG
jgi:phosphotransferase family enzyme